MSPASRAAPAPPSNRCSIDEIIVFHALGQSEIRSIVELQPERVRRTAQGQGVELVTDRSLVDHRAAAGFRPEFGARELRRLIRTELETQLARAMLTDAVHEGDRILARWDGSEQTVVLEPQPGAAQGESNPAGRRRSRPRRTKDRLRLNSGPLRQSRAMVFRPG